MVWLTDTLTHPWICPYFTSQTVLLYLEKKKEKKREKKKKKKNSNLSSTCLGIFSIGSSLIVSVNRLTLGPVVMFTD